MFVNKADQSSSVCEPLGVIWSLTALSLPQKASFSASLVKFKSRVKRTRSFLSRSRHFFRSMDSVQLYEYCYTVICMYSVYVSSCLKRA